MAFNGPHTEETRAKIASGLRKAYKEGTRDKPDGETLKTWRAEQVAAGQSVTHAGSFLAGEHHRNWKNDEIAYRTAHQRVQVQRGTPQLCEHCGRTGPGRRYEWAYSKTAKKRLVSDKGRPYSPDPDDYLRLCAACHHEYDKPENS